jgi:hypothetical protein
MTFRYLRLLLVLAISLTVCAQGLAAQDPPLTGSRVRVFLRATPQMAIGRLVSASADSIWLDVGPEGTVGIGREEIGRAERFMGVRGNARQGALIGFGAGAALGVIIGSTASTEDVDSGTFAVFFGLGLGAGGALLGAVIGSSVRREHWVPITAWDAQPDGGTLRLGFRFPFPVPPGT